MSDTALLLYSSSSSSPYGWDDKFRCDRLRRNDNEKCDDHSDYEMPQNLRYVSYDELGSIIELLCPIFSNYICMAQAGVNDCTKQPVIGISIPEGPYLVFAVLLVHILACRCQENESYDSSSVTSFGCESYFYPYHVSETKRSYNHEAPIIVPLDPTEGTERLGDMISDAKPCIILVVSIDGEYGPPSDDWIRVNSCVSSLKSSSSDSYSFYNPLILNMKSLVKEALIGQRNRHFHDHTIKLDDPPMLLNRYVRCTNRQKFLNVEDGINKNQIVRNCISHIVFTSGTTGRPKGCISSLYSLWNYIYAKNIAHSISVFTPRQDTNSETSSKHKVLLASALSFDPCISDIIATYYAKATLVIASRLDILHQLNLVLQISCTTHVLCTPSLWNTLTPLVHSRQEVKMQFPFLKVVALGGEPIPRRIVSLWAAETSTHGNIRLMATYGVTEACVYQTAGEIFYQHSPKQSSRDDDFSGDIPGIQMEIGQDVGKSFLGIKIHICREPNEVGLSSSLSSGISHLLTGVDPSFKHECGLLGVGEVVLSGSQLDEYSSYLNLPQLSAEKIFKRTSEYKRDYRCDDNTQSENNASVVSLNHSHDCFDLQVTENHNTQSHDESSHIQSINPCYNDEYFYRTGDRACFDLSTGHLRILGRINGEEGLIKFNGVRIELGELENAIQDPVIEGQTKRSYSIVERCVVVYRSKMHGNSERYLLAYCVLSASALNELGLNFSSFEENHGILCAPSPLLTLLRNRCQVRVRMGITPSKFILISSIPLTPTGKCNYKALPVFFELLSNISSQVHDSCNLFDYGRCGPAVANEIVSCLNIQPNHMSLLTVDACFAMLGGDSLSATRIVRGLYALHHGIDNVRTLGGSYGILEGPFNVSHLLGATNLGRYVDYLDQEGVLPSVGVKDNECLEDSSSMKTLIISHMTSVQFDKDTNSHGVIMYNSLYEATACNQTFLSLALLHEGANPNADDPGNRLGKTSGSRLIQKESFRSNPLHIACLFGNCILVEALLNNGCNFKSPDANVCIFNTHVNVVSNKEYVLNYLYCLQIGAISYSSRLFRSIVD